MVEKDTYNLILASNSPRRRELMERFGMPFRSVSHKLEDESVEDMEKKHEQEIVVEIALNKLRSLYDDYQENGVVILSADTMVFFNGHALGKPKDEEEAFQMLKAMSGEWHEVYTGCAIFIRTPEGKEHEIKFWEKTRVKFRKVPKPFIRHYCEGGSPLDKAGSYGIQDEGAFMIEKIAGDFYNVMGLPVGRIWELFLDFEVIPSDFGLND
jgi:septum formation protein